jgi:hypothetical protein
MELPIGYGKKEFAGRAVIYFSRSVGKDITTAATLLVVCDLHHTLHSEARPYVSGHLQILFPASLTAFTCEAEIGVLVMYVPQHCV